MSLFTRSCVSITFIECSDYFISNPSRKINAPQIRRRRVPTTTLDSYDDTPTTNSISFFSLLHTFSPRPTPSSSAIRDRGNIAASGAPQVQQVSTRGAVHALPVRTGANVPKCTFFPQLICSYLPTVNNYYKSPP